MSYRGDHAHPPPLANRGRSEKLRRCRWLLEEMEPEKPESEIAGPLMLRTRGIDIGRSPYCLPPTANCVRG
jgi:hypothetical protein